MSDQNKTDEQTVTADQTPSNVPPRPQSADNAPRTSHTCRECNFVATNQRELFYHNLKCPTAGELSPEALKSTPKAVQPKAAKSAPTSTSNQSDRGATLGDLDALAALKEQMEGRG